MAIAQGVSLRVPIELTLRNRVRGSPDAGRGGSYPSRSCRALVVLHSAGGAAGAARAVLLWIEAIEDTELRRWRRAYPRARSPPLVLRADAAIEARPPLLLPS